MKKQHIVLLTGIILILGFVLGGYLYKKQQSGETISAAQGNASAFVREHSQSIGSDDAKVLIVEFLDPACEACAAFYPFVKSLMKENPGKIKLVVRYAPFHPGSDRVVAMLEAAKKQGKYWETLEVMLKTQQHWASHHNPQPDLLWKFLTSAGLNLKEIKHEMKNPEIGERIAQDLADGKTLNVKKTPQYFVNGKPLEKFGYDQLRELVESEIRAKY